MKRTVHRSSVDLACTCCSTLTWKTWNASNRGELHPSCSIYLRKDREFGARVAVIKIPFDTTIQPQMPRDAPQAVSRYENSKRHFAPREISTALVSEMMVEVSSFNN